MWLALKKKSDIIRKSKILHATIFRWWFSWGDEADDKRLSVGEREPRHSTPQYLQAACVRLWLFIGSMPHGHWKPKQEVLAVKILWATGVHIVILKERWKKNLKKKKKKTGEELKIKKFTKCTLLEYQATEEPSAVEPDALHECQSWCKNNSSHEQVGSRSWVSLS